MTSSPAPLPIEQPVARDTLIVADFATNAEHGAALLASGRRVEAIPLLRAGLVELPSDPVALLGLTRALTETGSELDEARRMAERLIELAPQSEVGHEAMLRVCLAAHESECAVREWKMALRAPDAGARSRVLFDLQAPTENAARRLHAHRFVPAPSR
jgi:tetratricopeptide (TPR) repeat protein